MMLVTDVFDALPYFPEIITGALLRELFAQPLVGFTCSLIAGA